MQSAKIIDYFLLAASTTAAAPNPASSPITAIGLFADVGVSVATGFIDGVSTESAANLLIPSASPGQ